LKEDEVFITPTDSETNYCEPCASEHYLCQGCDTKVSEKTYVGECGECEKHIHSCCGKMLGDEAYCHGCVEESSDTEDFTTLATPYGEVFLDKDSGDLYVKIDADHAGDKIGSHISQGKFSWEWTKKTIGGTVYLINHFNMVTQLVKNRAPGTSGWVGMYNPTTGALDTTAPEPASL
jgi:hypothetical protein